MKRRGVLFWCLVFSLLMHAGLLGASTVLWLPGAAALAQETKKMFDIKAVAVQSLPFSQVNLIQAYVRKLKFQNPGTETRRVSGLSRTMRDKIQGVKEIDLLNNKEELAEAKKRTAADARAEKLKEQMAAKKRKIDLNTHVELDVFKATERWEGALEDEIDLPETFREQMFAFTPSSLSQVESSARPAAPVKGTAFGAEDGEVLDDVMRVQILTYRDPKDGQGYYRISLVPGEDAKDLKVMPKEIVFLVDASLSIQGDRLKQFARGISYAIENLNPGDRFNIYTFKDRISPLAQAPLPSSKKNARKAVEFLSRLKPSMKTDIYEAFLESIQKPASMLPSYMIFLSDGRPTQGVVSSAKLISEISRLNGRKRPIFAFSGGVRVNRYLLDFLSYQNRGWSEYAGRNFQISLKIKNLYDKIRNPILTNIRYQLTGVDGEEIYPKHMPDFYLNTEFVIYGQFRDEKEFTMRLVGEANGKTSEILFTGNLKDADQGNEEIARHWAFNKYYHLVSQITLDKPTAEREAEVEALSKKYGIISPYDF